MDCLVTPPGNSNPCPVTKVRVKYGIYAYLDRQFCNDVARPLQFTSFATQFTHICDTVKRVRNLRGNLHTTKTILTE